MEITPELRVAVAAEYARRVSQVERREKDEIRDEFPIGTRLPVVSDAIGEDGRPVTIGTVSVKRPPGDGKPRIELDEAVVLPWAVEQFGEDAVEEIVRLRPQYRDSVIAAAKTALANGQPLPPGVTVTKPVPGAPVVEWRRADGIDAAKELAAMARRGVLNINEVLELE